MEAQYVENLILHEGSTLDLAGATLYYKNFTNLGGEVILNGGTFQQVPEPASLALLAIGGLVLRRRRR
jgi:hypothetical protein